MTDFGAFVEIEEGVDGLVHVSDISWSKKIKHPKDVLKKGQEVEAVITNMDIEGRRLSLSIKELTPSVWDDFTTKYHAGDVIKGKISRFASFGVFVELAPDLEGLCHISELSDDRIENPEDQFEIGQELDFKILRIEQDVEKIGLSHRAVGKDDEAKVVESSKSYSSQAKGGMASLGELANLKFGGKTEEAKADETPDDKSEKVESIKEELELDDSAENAEVKTDEVREETTAENSEEAVAETTEEAVAEASVDENTSETKDAEAEASSVEAKDQTGKSEKVTAENTPESEEKVVDDKAEVTEEASAASESETESTETSTDSDEAEQEDSSETKSETATDTSENNAETSAETVVDEDDEAKKKGAKS